MPVNFLVALSEQAEELCNLLFVQAVIALDKPDPTRLDRVCSVLERALERDYRRKGVAGLLPVR